MVNNTNTLFKNSNFLKALASYGIDDLGTWFDMFALQLIFVHQWHASGLMVASIFALYMLPIALFSQFTGGIVDRFNEAKLLAYLSILSGFLTILLVLSGSPYSALTLIFIRSLVLSLANPCQHALTKAIVEIGRAHV